MNNYWHWTMAPILFGHKLPFVTDVSHFSVVVTWLNIGYGLLGWGVGVLIGQSLYSMIHKKK